VNYDRLIDDIRQINGTTQTAIARAANQVMTLRNWLIGAYIVEYEQQGDDRAVYGEALLKRLAHDLRDRGLKGLSLSNLKSFRKFALTYPALAKSQTLSVLLENWFPDFSLNLGKPETAGLGAIVPPPEPTLAFPSLVARSETSTALPWQDSLYYQRMLQSLSWSHLLELCRIEDPVKRAFYELECLKSNWASRELKRQVNSLLYERVGLSRDKEAVLALAQEGRLVDSPATILRDPYVLEFLGLDTRSAYSESELEAALLKHLQHFIHELGRDFCFVERQFRITVGNQHYFLDLLFYHRRLRCLVAIDLKLGEFRPDYAGQMNFYLNYLKREVAHPDENPPVGILLCADRDVEEVHYATAGMDSQLFVSRYLVALPSEETLKTWLREEQERLKVRDSKE